LEKVDDVIYFNVFNMVRHAPVRSLPTACAHDCAQCERAVVEDYKKRNTRTVQVRTDRVN
jgi:hypothetical protein